jgi:hypothetical protein
MSQRKGRGISVVAAANFAFDPERHEYSRDGRVIRSVTQILNDVGLVCYDHIPKAILDHKAEIGIAAHQSCWFLDEQDLDWSTVHPQVEPYVRAWEKFRAETDFTPDADGIEQRGIATIDGMDFGYQFDRKGVFQGRPMLVEIKCTAAVEMSWGPQLSAYEMALHAIEKYRRSRMAVHLKPNGNYTLIPFNEPQDYQVFRWALGIVSWTRKKGRNPNGNRNHYGN